jgi:hypothetical protein
MITVTVTLTPGANLERFIATGARSPISIRLDEATFTREQRARIALCGTWEPTDEPRRLALADKRADPSFQRGLDASFQIAGLPALAQWREIENNPRARELVMRAIERSIAVNP